MIMKVVDAVMIVWSWCRARPRTPFAHAPCPPRTHCHVPRAVLDCVIAMSSTTDNIGGEMKSRTRVLSVTLGMISVIAFPQHASAHYSEQGSGVGCAIADPDLWTCALDVSHTGRPMPGNCSIYGCWFDHWCEMTVFSYLPGVAQGSCAPGNGSMECVVGPNESCWDAYPSSHYIWAGTCATFRTTATVINTADTLTVTPRAFTGCVDSAGNPY